MTSSVAPPCATSDAAAAATTSRPAPGRMTMTPRAHRAPALRRSAYSGSMVAAPPRTASRGSTCLVANSLRYGIRARQVVRNLALGPRHLDVDRAGIERHLVAGIEHEVAALDVGLGQVDGVGDDADPGQHVADADEVLAQRRLVAARQAVTPQVAGLEVRGLDRQHVAFPAARSRSLPRCAARVVRDAGGRPSRWSAPGSSRRCWCGTRPRPASPDRRPSRCARPRSSGRSRRGAGCTGARAPSTATRVQASARARAASLIAQPLVLADLRAAAALGRVLVLTRRPFPGRDRPAPPPAPPDRTRSRPRPPVVPSSWTRLPLQKAGQPGK